MCKIWYWTLANKQRTQIEPFSKPTSHFRVEFGETATVRHCKHSFEQTHTAGSLVPKLPPPPPAKGEPGNEATLWGLLSVNSDPLQKIGSNKEIGCSFMRLHYWLNLAVSTCFYKLSIISIMYANLTKLNVRIME